MTDEKQGSRASLEQLADSLRTAPKYCEVHKPCDAKEHQPGYGVARDVFAVTFGALTLGLTNMFAINAILSDWLAAVPVIGYWESVAGTQLILLMAYALRLIAKR